MMQRRAAIVSEDGEILLQKPEFSQLVPGIVSEAGDSMLQHPSPHHVPHKRGTGFAPRAPLGDSYFQTTASMHRGEAMVSESAGGAMMHNEVDSALLPLEDDG